MSSSLPGLHPGDGGLMVERVSRAGPPQDIEGMPFATLDVPHPYWSHPCKFN
ncbi:MAG: hypothetical protein M3Z16_00360 [Pseudomonadota bacterium]|nr:hypothetical protein [Pseudomonadota bacterium]